jgi:hypothetical protein
MRCDRRVPFRFSALVSPALTVASSLGFTIAQCWSLGVLGFPENVSLDLTGVQCGVIFGVHESTLRLDHFTRLGVTEIG